MNGAESPVYAKSLKEMVLPIVFQRLPAKTEANTGAWHGAEKPLYERGIFGL
jgi:hypothetical protein